jgi:hypothetical protein
MEMLPFRQVTRIENVRHYFFAMVSNEYRPIEVDSLWRTQHQEESIKILKTIAKNGSIQFPARQKTIMRSFKHHFCAQAR